MAHRKINSFTVGDTCVKVYRDSEWDQYICKPFIDGKAQSEASWYFTDDRDDAIRTSRTMAYTIGNFKR